MAVRTSVSLKLAQDNSMPIGGVVYSLELPLKLGQVTLSWLVW